MQTTFNAKLNQVKVLVTGRKVHSVEMQICAAKLYRNPSPNPDP